MLHKFFDRYDGKNGSCPGYVFAGTFGLLLRQASLGVNFCAPPAAESKPQKFPYAPLKHNPATHFYSYFKKLM
ncbi:MAG TPA: hypothetical protein DCL49_02850 [Candidatus Omnitrophica bacterium]|nr:hypothetical protein [Candidatus Omnitrophota bacterium]